MKSCPYPLRFLLPLGGLCAAASILSAESTLAGPRTVTADIEAGIRQHIAEKQQADGGTFDVAFEGEELRLQLVRVHTEYLSTLEKGRHFACVDLVDEQGDVYDVDFFLEGEPGAMEVTETTVHKLNGQPYYAWEQQADGTWARVAVEEATNRELGVINGTDVFRFHYRATVPEVEETTGMWIPIARSNEFQEVALVGRSLPVAADIVRDEEFGNEIAYLELGPENSGDLIEFVYEVARREKSSYPEELSRADRERFLAPETLTVPNDEIVANAREAIAGETSDLMKARALYDHVIDRMFYAKAGQGWGRGDAVYACNARTGNCTDYHAYFMALARSVGIPARFAIGFPIPAHRDAGGISGYHCWAEFYADGKWWPVDISEADKYSRLSTYYFGHHPANRIEFSEGRDLLVEPAPPSGQPLNFLAYPYMEIDGEQVRVPTEFTFERLDDSGHTDPMEITAALNREVAE